MTNRIIHLLIFFLWSGLTISAVPVKPGTVRNITLDDGSTVRVTLVGDEHGHYWLAEDGRAFVKNSERGAYELTDSRVIKEKARIRRSAAGKRCLQRLNGRKTPYVGSKKGLIILVNFSNLSMQEEHNKALFNDIANKEGYVKLPFMGSVHDYFLDQSMGQFDLTFDVVGPLTLSRKYSYYGENFESGADKRPGSMVIDACKLANASVNFSNYDWDGDGEVDQVYILYAGIGESDGGSEDTIWPHQWDLASASYYGDGSGPLKLDGVTINNYACSAELNGDGRINGIGTICHEFSHCLGFPDFYEQQHSGGRGMGYWDLMDYGSHNADGFLPSGYTSYERWVAGWAEPVELSSSVQIQDMKALHESAESYIIYNEGNRNEYYLLENRQRVGWDRWLPGVGLLIIHVDYDESAWNTFFPNNDPDHQRMTWIAADNKYDYELIDDMVFYKYMDMQYDPFPYGSVNAFGRNTTPAAELYHKNTDGTYFLDSSVENITQNSDKTISFYFNGGTNAIAHIDAAPDQSEVLYDLQGRRYSSGANLSKGIYIVNGRKKVVR